MWHRTLMATLVMAGALTCLTAQDQAIKDTDGEKSAPVAEAVELVSGAATLVEYGRRTKSPEALITAAGMLKRVPPSTLLKGAADQEQPLPAGSGELPSLRDEAEALLGEAKKLSNNDPAVVALADAVAGRKVTRGGAGGPRLVQNTLLPKSSFTFQVKVVGGLPLSFGVAGAGNLPLGVSVRFHGGGNNVLVVEGKGLAVQRAFVPPVDGSLHIRVSNPNKIGTAYRIVTN